MSVTFKMVGKLSMPRETEKFHPFTEQSYPSGWKRKVLNFSVQSDTNSHMLTIQSGCFADGHGMIYTAKEVREDGKQPRTENIQIPFKDRLKQKFVEEVAPSRKFILDLEIPGRRRTLADLSAKVTNGLTLTDEELKSVGVDNQNEIEDALNNSNKLRKEFISEWDFIDAVKAVLEDSAYSGKKFRITGFGDYSYNERFYENLVPRRIYLESDSADEYAEETVTLYTNNGSVDEMSVEELGKYFISGWHREYVNCQQFKSNVFVPIKIVRNVGDTDKAKKISKRLMEFFKHDDDDALYQCRVILNMLNGSPRVKLTPEMLSEEDRELLEMELVSWSDLANKYGGSAYGERVTELDFVRFGVLDKQNVPVASIYTIDDTVLPVSEDTNDALFKDVSDEDEL